MTHHNPTRDEFNQSRRDAYNFFMKQQFIKLWESNPDLIEDELSQEVIRAVKEINGKCACTMITINFKPDIEMMDAELHMRLQKYLNRKWVGTYKYCWEFVTKSGFHPHIHLVTKCVKPRSQLLRDTYNTFKKYVNGIECIDIKTSYNLTRALNYLNKNREGDIAYRKKYCLAAAYGGLTSPKKPPKTTSIDAVEGNPALASHGGRVVPP